MVVITKQMGLFDLLKRGIKQANQLNQRVLVSQVMPITSVDPLSFFYNGRSIFNGNRFFWSDTEGMQLAGLGSTFQFEGYQKNRFQDIEKQWNRLLIQAVLDIDNQKGTGPLLFGGSTFDPQKQKGNVWGDFPDAGFIVPTFMLTKNDQGVWLSINKVVDGHELPNELADLLMGQLDKLLASSPVMEEIVGDDLVINEVSPSEWLYAVRQMASEIQKGKMDKVVLARELNVEASHPFTLSHILKQLQNQQEDSFVFAIEKGETAFIGATPERLIKKDGHTLYTTCLAGTVSRGHSSEEEKKLGQFLLNDNKNLIEHKAVVDMITSTMADVCEQIDVPSHPTLYKVGNIQHLYTPIIGHASLNSSLLSIVEKLHPTPALGGSPREYAMKKIRELEPQDRGWYASPIGWIDLKGNGEFAVAIRSGVIKDNKATLYAGCGIVGDSDPKTEYEETKLKFRPMLSALGGRFK